MDELEGPTQEDRESLKKSLNDLIRETPNTRVAETRFKRLMKKRLVRMDTIACARSRPTSSAIPYARPSSVHDVWTSAGAV